MGNFNIQNSADKKIIIDILGGIGGSFFDEGTTMQSIAEQLTEADEIELNISSLGGSLVHALAIHDMLKMHSAKVTSNIIGMTASAGTIIALAGDTINMSDNSLFLIHNARTSADGNANDLREAAEDLDKADAIISGIYQKRINSVGKNKKKSEILSLMEKEKWINADEALTWGFVDNKILAKNVIKNEIINAINDSEYLPKLNKMENTFLNSILNLFGKKAEDEGVEASVIAEIEALKTDLTNREELVNTLTNEVAEIKALNDTLNAEITAKETTVQELQAKVTEMEIQINTLKAKKTEPKAVADPSLNNEPKQKTAAEKAAAEAVAGLEKRW